MTQIEKLAARMRTLKPGHLYRVQLIVGRDGQPVLWAVDDGTKVEGFGQPAGDQPEEGAQE